MAIHEGTKGAKEEHNALGADMLLNWAEHATPNVFASAARLYTGMRLADRHRPIANLVISNVPGPDFPLYLGGAELKAGFPLGPVMDGMGVNITIMSYRGVLYWGIMACPEIDPPALEPDRRHPAGPRRAPRGRRRGAGHLPVRGAGRCRRGRRDGVRRRPAPLERRRGSATAAGAQGAGATAIDEAPEHTGMGRPKVWRAGSVGDDGVEPVHHEGTGAARADHDVGRVLGARARRSAGRREVAPESAGSEKVASGTGLTQLLAESATSSIDPSGVTAMAAGSAMPNWSNPVVGWVAPVAATMGRTRPPKSVPPCPTT